MTNDEIRIAVADLCGWKKHMRIGRGFSGRPTSEDGWLMPNGTFVRGGSQFPPNYPESLDACAEMEANLKDENEKRLYISHLVNTLKSGEFAVMAPANNRCRAFLSTKNWIPKQ